MDKPVIEETFPKLERPQAMLFERGVHFAGGETVERFRKLIYYFIKISGFLYGAIRYRRKRTNVKDGTVVLVTRDWGTSTSLNKESLRSLREYCGEDRVHLLELKRYDDLLKSIENYLEENNVSHVVLDTRIMLTRYSRGAILNSLYNCYYLSRLVWSYGAVLICGMTDIIESGQRIQGELAVSKSGLLVSWGSVGTHEVPRFIEPRIVGPLFVPMSWRTWKEYDDNFPEDAPTYDLSIIGLNYEPRKSFVEELLPKLKSEGVSYYLNMRKDLDYLSYLHMFGSSKIGFNTNWVVNQPDRYHFTHRNFEVMFTGSLLITQKCYGLDMYMQEGLDYVSFSGVDELMEKIKYYLSHEEERLMIARSGQNKVRQLIADHFVWVEVDKALNIFSYNKLPKGA